MDERYVLAAARYVERNPVRAGLVKAANEWPWSSARAHLARSDDVLVRVKPLLEVLGDWEGFLQSEAAEEELFALRRHERTGRPLGSDGFLERLEKLLGRTLRCAKPGPKGNGRQN
jgi:putative transposase